MLPRKVQITALETSKPKFMGKSANYEFVVQVDSSDKYKLRTSSEKERQQWVDLLIMHSQRSVAKKNAVGGASED